MSLLWKAVRSVRKALVTGRVISSDESLVTCVSKKSSSGLPGVVSSELHSNSSSNESSDASMQTVKSHFDVELQTDFDETKNTAQDEDLFELLPDEIVLHLCRFLPKDITFVSFKSTCRRLHYLLEDKDVWQVRMLALHDLVLTPIVIRLLLNQLSITKLDVSDCMQITNKFLFCLIRDMPNLNHLNISGCPLVTDKCMIAIREFVVTLVSLSIARCRFISCQALLQVVKKHQSTLKMLDLTDSIGLLRDRYYITDIVEYLPNIEHLNISWNGNNGEFSLILNSDLERIATTCKKLIYLNVGNGQMHMDGLDAVAKNCHDLRYLCLTNSFTRSHTFVDLSSKLALLKHLDLSGCCCLADTALQAIPRSMAKLRYLSLSRCIFISDGTVDSLLNCLNQLRDFILRDCFHITESGLGRLYQHPTLLFLDISGTQVSKDGLEDLRARGPSKLALIIKTENCPRMRSCHCDDTDTWEDARMFPGLKRGFLKGTSP